LRRARLLWVLLLFGCAGTQGGVRLAEAPPPRDAAALRDAVDAYYAAKDAVGLRAAVDAARKAGPDAAPYHEIAADLARFEARHAEEFAHLVAALQDPADDAALLHLHQLDGLSWTLPQRAEAESLLRSLVARHPDPEVRALAGTLLAYSLHLRADPDGRDAALRAAGFRLPFAVIGTWDNDQGKGFDAEYPPERGIDLAATYHGRLVDVGWRTDYALDPRGRVDLAEMLDPDRWQVAYAASAVEAPAGDYELRLSTTAPVKVWVNDTLVFAGRRVDGWVPDGFVLPVKLRAGVNRVLVKSAQEEGSWLLSARLTRAGGALPDDVRAVSPDRPVATGERPVAEPWSDEALAAARVARLPAGTARRDFHAALWADRMGLRVPAVQRADAFLGAHPGSLAGRYRLVVALWNEQERGRTADLLGDLARDAGDDLPLLRLQQARFWSQQHLQDKARDLLLAVRDAHPDRPQAWLDLADIFQDEGWREDRCATLEEADRRWPAWPTVRLELADCLESIQRDDRAAALYRDLLDALPNSQAGLTGLLGLAMATDRLDEAAALARRTAAGWPHLLSPWERLGEALRRAGDANGAAEALRHLVDSAPTDATGYERLAALAYQQGHKDEAVALWQKAIDRDPENERLANRLAFLAPADRGPWMADAPDEAALDAAVAAREKLQPASGANVVYLMDDEVTELKADGSTANLVTLVAHAVNDAGRDNLTQMDLRGGGRSRILHAYAVGPDGKRAEAASIRGREVRFRNLRAGSTVVLQYRLDSPPDGYLAGHMARQWWFQGNGVQAVRSRWVLWAPAGTTLHEAMFGPVKREYREAGHQIRVAWIATDQPPLTAEPGMPTPHEVVANVMVSTVPDWDQFLKWEEALLQDAFRVSPEVEALAKKLFDGVTDPQEKLRRILQYEIENVTYQQDYERAIAGVKPHAAPVVLERHYGDCKDKAVLFITLARLAGIQVHFALVRTREAGPVWRDVPMQQFNHAIVYVPQQPGIAEGRFYDPTVDALDLAVLRPDDQGTWSLVYDPQSGQHAWRPIPYQDPAVDYTSVATVLRLDADGAADAESELTAQGGGGALLRRSARNAEQFAQLLQTQLAGTYPGVRVLGEDALELTDLRKPAKLKVKFRAPANGRREGGALRLRVPIGWSPEPLFSLAQRRFPLVLGTPRTLSWRVELVPPAGATVQRLPEGGDLAGDCVSLSRRVTTTAPDGPKAPPHVVVDQTVRITCERIDTAAYDRHRAVAEQMMRLLNEELVLGVPAGPPAAGQAARM
jgi:tetratricopeptide (TPR) repeat protein/transglutaminase-like putative cysteine protease